MNRYLYRSFDYDLRSSESGSERDTVLEDIVRYLETAESESSPIPDSQVRSWMSSDNPEVLGATASLLMQSKLVQRITPSLSFNEVFSFFLRYYEFCLKNDPHGEWVDNRFTAGCDLVSSFVSLWDEGRDQKYFRDMKSMLARLYIEGSGDLKHSIEQGVVEHLFERRNIQEFFSDWRDDPRLRPAYDAGKLWAEGGGRSPLTQPRHRES